MKERIIDQQKLDVDRWALESVAEAYSVFGRTVNSRRPLNRNDVRGCAPPAV